MRLKKKPPILWTLFHLWRVWRRWPQLRLGQLLVCALTDYDLTIHLFNLHDETIVAELKELSENLRRL